MLLSDEITQIEHADKLTKMFTLNRQTPSCEETASMRGMVTRGSGIIARPMKRFYPVETRGFPETYWKNLRDKEFTATRFIDGYSTVYYPSIQNLPMLAGSSEFFKQPLLSVTSWYRTRHRTAKWPEGYTPNFVVVHPDYPRRVQYRDLQTYLVALVHETGTELGWNDVVQWGNFNEIQTPEVVRGSLAEIARATKEDRGVVFRWDIEGEAPLRVSMLAPEFDKIHRIVTGLSPADICDLLEARQNTSALKGDSLPREFRNWFEQWELAVQDLYQSFETTVCEYFSQVDGEYEFPLTLEETKEAMQKLEKLVIAEDRWTLPILEKLLADDSYEHLLWKLVRSRVRDQDGWRE